jgi:uncharacterized protein YecE (DUF72 family)
MLGPLRSRPAPSACGGQARRGDPAVPRVVHPRPEAWAELATVGARLPDYRLAVELRSPKWFEDDACEGTLEWLEERGLSLVCVDGPSSGLRATPLVAAATADLAVVRFLGRRQVENESWAAPYRYSSDELAEWVTRLTELASSAPEVHVLMDNCWGSDAVDNAAQLAALLRGRSLGRRLEPRETKGD